MFSIALFLGPLAFAKGFSYYRNSKTPPSPSKPAIRPVPTRIWPAIALLIAAAALYVAQTTPAFEPENIFVRTQSRLLTPVDVLFTRLAALRPGQMLTTRDEALRARLVNLESRLLYFQYGPEALGDCPFCNSDEPDYYFFYTVVDLLRPHFVNFVLMVLVTSSIWTDVHGSQWRTLSALAAACLAAIDIFIVKTYDHQSNSASIRLEDIDFFFWSMRCYRLVALAALDTILAVLIYLSCTNRAFITLPSAPERIEALTRSLMSVKSKMSAMGIVRNTALRDSDLRSRSQAYWAHEVRLMSEVMEERDVVEGINDALSSRIDMQAVLKDADAYTQAVLQPLQSLTPDDAT